MLGARLPMPINKEIKRVISQSKSEIKSILSGNLINITDGILASICYSLYVSNFSFLTYPFIAKMKIYLDAHFTMFLSISFATSLSPHPLSQYFLPFVFFKKIISGIFEIALHLKTELKTMKYNILC